MTNLKTLSNDDLMKEFVNVAVNYQTLPFERYEAHRAEVMRRLESSAYALEDFNAETDELKERK